MKTHRIVVLPGELRAACAAIVNAHGRFVTMVASDERQLDPSGFVLRYVFAAAGEPRLTVVECVLPESNPHYPSVSTMIPGASWAEREGADLFGLHPDGHPDLRPLVLHEHWPAGVFPLRKEYPLSETQARDTTRPWQFPKVEGDGVFEVPVGPIHAGVIEPGHFRFQVMGDSVLHLEAKLFYTHRGMEKRSEGMSVQKGLFLAERICGVCSVSHALSYAQAVEGIAGTRVPDRANFMRVLLTELERLYNHIGDVGNLCAGVGYAYGSSHGARLKERLMQLNDISTGHRFLRHSIALGGIAHDIPGAGLQVISETVREVQQDFHEIVEQILSSDIVVNRFSDTGVLTEDIVRDFAAVGPTARASNRDVDVRRDLPYAAYDQLSFRVPRSAKGDVLARFQQRVLEVDESCGLIQQVIQRIPAGAVRVPLGPLPAHTYGIGITESPRGENVHFVFTGDHDTIYRYRVRSAPYANWPVVPFSVPGNIVPDFPLINKSFELCYACCDR